VKDEKNLDLNKVFLLVFHGGMVCYLILHNFLIPFTRNIGQGESPLLDTHYWFLPQLLLLLVFIRKPLMSNIGFWMNLNVFISVIQGFLLLFLFNKLEPSTIFSEGVSFAAVMVFYLGFFLHFKQFYKLNFQNFSRDFVLSLVFGLIFVFIQHKLLMKKEIILMKKNVLVEEERVVLDLPYYKYSKNKIIELSSDNFKDKFSYYTLEDITFFINNDVKKHVFRLERLHYPKWDFVSVVVLDKGERFKITSDKKEIFRLRSPSSRELGIHYLVFGPEKFSRKKYIIYKSKVELNDE
jgi:hypothetical protein